MKAFPPSLTPCLEGQIVRKGARQIPGAVARGGPGDAGFRTLASVLVTISTPCVAGRADRLRVGLRITRGCLNWSALPDSIAFHIDSSSIVYRSKLLGGHMNWKVLAGLVEWSWDEALRDLGRQRFHGQVHADPPYSGQSSVETDRAGFLVQRHPWRLALLGVEGRMRGSTLIDWGSNFNMAIDLLDGLLTQEVVGPHDSVGDRGLRRMLEPTSLEKLIPKPWPDQFTLEGQALTEDMFVAPDLVTLGSDSYNVTCDPELGVLLTWQAMIEGQVAHSQTLRAITLLD
jgi:hypothetical protein